MMDGSTTELFDPHSKSSESAMEQPMRGEKRVRFEDCKAFEAKDSELQNKVYQGNGEYLVQDAQPKERVRVREDTKEHAMLAYDTRLHRIALN